MWYDTAAVKYQEALHELKIAREKAKSAYSGIVSVDGPFVKKWKDRVHVYEEKLYRASAVLHNVTMVMVAVDKCEDAKEVILDADDDDEESIEEATVENSYVSKERREGN